MEENKKFVLDKETLEVQREKLRDLIESDKESIAENDAISKDPKNVFDNQGEWAEARKKGSVEALNRHEQLLSETIERIQDMPN